MLLDGAASKKLAVIALTAPTDYEQYKDRSCFADQCIHTMLVGSKKNTENVYIKISTRMIVMHCNVCKNPIRLNFKNAQLN